MTYLVLHLVHQHQAVSRVRTHTELHFCYSVVMPHEKKLTTPSLSLSVQLIERRIYLIRGQKVMIDFDLAEL